MHYRNLIALLMVVGCGGPQFTSLGAQDTDGDVKLDNDGGEVVHPASGGAYAVADGSGSGGDHPIGDSGTYAGGTTSSAGGSGGSGGADPGGTGGEVGSGGHMSSGGAFNSGGAGTGGEVVGWQVTAGHPCVTDTGPCSETCPVNYMLCCTKNGTEDLWCLCRGSASGVVTPDVCR